jgi:nitrite reductase/ring-hydroxylating ferredoxin subunit
MSEWHKVLKASAVGKGEMKGAKVGEADIAVYNVDGTFFATDNLCTHEFAFLTDGWLDGEAVECPFHQARFDVKTGKVLAPPACKDLHTYPTRVSGDDVEVQIA